jgi:penicillin-binding protein 2
MQDGGRLRFDPVIPNRANIYDTEGRVLANQNGRVITINLIPQGIPRYGECVAALADALDLPANDVELRIVSRPSNWVIDVGVIETQTYVDTYVSLEQFCGATFTDRPARQYENGELASHIVGYVGYPDPSIIPEIEAAGFSQDAILGRSGVEFTWDSTLRGQPGGRLVIAASDGSIIREVARVSAQPGQSVWLTLDLELQAATQEIIANAYRNARGAWAEESRGSAIVVMDVRTGALLASVSYPTFDNNAYTVYPVMGREAAQQIIERNQADRRNPELNRVAQGVYTLGSVMKTISAAAAADSGVYSLNERYTCNAIWSRDIQRFDWTSVPHGTLTLAGALTQSCNPYFYEVGYRLNTADPWILPTYARRLGFGAETGIPDIAESAGLIPDPNWLQTTYGLPWTFSEEVNMAIGQGYVQVTPLQVVRWFAAIANGGALPRPYIVSQIGLLGDPMREAYEPEFTPTELRPEVLDVIREGMCAVTSTSAGTAEFVFRDSPLQTYGVCGKTGTAQDDPRNSHAWFAAYAPRENPEIAVVVMVENSGQGSEVAAPIARAVLEAYFGLTP